MKRTTGTRLTAWLGILAVCLAVFMPGVNALKNRYMADEVSIFLADICFGAQPANGAQDTAPHGGDIGQAHHGSQAVVLASVVDTAPAGGPSHSSGHSADHAAECLYCGFFTHHLPLLHAADLPVAAFGFVDRIAPQHQRVSYYARPAFVPPSRAPPLTA